VRQLARRRVDFCTVHGNDGCAGGRGRQGRHADPGGHCADQLDQGDLDDPGFRCDARSAPPRAAGCDGVVFGLEVSALRAAVDHALITVSASVPSSTTRSPCRTKSRVATPKCHAAGADYLVVGRPIRDAGDPRAAAEAVQAQIAAACKS
jgi:orotidine-5'-phosphate decarboxylase